ncbi:hypothetical protein SLEP1_g13235 [Rubroshorea leprosula]|uniref:Uncharacterized protein n=1 Tax=Rubroshorea leprosula TaxID=152421 RepID=A0AAV5IL61_9ROSI|nr:hypothetical protein SLEP1_g13235 [Rubroshorea leprosula]
MDLCANRNVKSLESNKQDYDQDFDTRFSWAGMVKPAS